MRPKEEWETEGNCYGYYGDPDPVFFLDRGGRPREAKEFYCSMCPVAQECHDYAVLYKEVGIWGGSTDGERAKISPYLRPRLVREAQEAGLPTEHRLVPIVPREICSGPIESLDSLDGPSDSDLSSIQQMDNL